MASNKENRQSRIPVKIGKIVSNRREDKLGQNAREPLRTLANQNQKKVEGQKIKKQNSENLAGPSHGNKVLDTRFVTYRSNNEELDWKFEVFNDMKETKENVKKAIKPTKENATSREGQLATSTSSARNKRVLHPGKSIDKWSRVYAMDNLSHLLSVERKVVAVPKVLSASRSRVINWMIKVNGKSGCPLVVHLACWYLDSYLATTVVTVSRLQLIAAACFWLASKIHGSYITGCRLARYSGNVFLVDELVVTESHLLRKLKFEALTVTPYDFIPYLSWCCDDAGTGVVESAALFICQCGLMIDKTLTHEYPSVVAAAAVKNAIILLRQNIKLTELQKCSIYNEAEAKATNLNGTCVQLRDAVRMVASVGYEYKIPVFISSGPPFYTSNKIIRAVNYQDIVLIDEKYKKTDRRN